MLAFIIQRLMQAVLVMLTVALIAFALFNYVGDPINNMVGQDTNLQDRERLRQELGLTEPDGSPREMRQEVEILEDQERR